MSFGNVLVAASEVSFDMARPLEQLHPAAYTPPVHEDSGDTYAEALDKFCELAPAYKYLAWEAIGAVYDAANQEDKRYNLLVDASAAGIVGMVRYLSKIPFVYDHHYTSSPDGPKSLSQHVEALGAVAKRSDGFAQTVASESVQVSGVIEKDDKLRGKLSPNLRVRSEDATHKYVLRDAGEGLAMQSRFGIEGRIEAIRNMYEYENPEGRKLDRAPGCLALLIGRQDGKSVFHKMWDSCVDAATTDSRLFRADLLALTDMHHEWEEPTLQVS